LGTVIVEFHLELHGDLSPAFSWKFTVTMKGRVEPETLMVVTSAEYKRICKDLKELSTFKTEIGNEGSFLQISDRAFYIYGHKAHTAYSSVQILDVVTIWMKLSEKRSFLAACYERDCHEVFYSYFYANDQCKFLLGSSHGSDASTQPDALTQLKDMPSKNADDAKSPHENKWTHRLHVCLGTMKIKLEFTFDLCPVSRSWNSRLPDDIGNNSLVFHGTPDIIITVKNEGITMESNSSTIVQLLQRMLKSMIQRRKTICPVVKKVGEYR